MSKTIRLTAAQALVRYLAALRTESAEGEQPLFGGVFAIFGHGNVAGIGEALYQYRDRLPTYRAHNEQAMTLAAIAYAKANMRRRMMACTTSIGPGATNMVTAAAVAYVNCLSVVCIETDPNRSTTEGGWWWEVAVPEVSQRQDVVAARKAYEQGKQEQKV